MRFHSSIGRAIEIGEAQALPSPKSLLTLIAVAAMFGSLLIIANPRPVLSQAVKLVQVDVNVVAQGYRVSKLSGGSVTNEKNEKIGSIDDFVITFFTAGAGTVTLPLQIYSMIKIAVTPEVNAVSTLLMLLTLALIVIASRLVPSLLRSD